MEPVRSGLRSLAAHHGAPDDCRGSSDRSGREMPFRSHTT
jgi:hypothetical protein